jgi:hypothetical protein
VRINIETIPHEQQRYPTCGDYWIDPDGIIQVRVSEMNNASARAVIVHEIFELMGVIQTNIPIESIDAFDIEFEKNRQPGNLDEPGDQPDAPYHHLHRLATIAEMLWADGVGLNWKKHEANVNTLF